MWDSLDHDFNDRSPTIPDCVYVCMALNDKCCLRHFHFYYLLFYTIHILRQQQQLSKLCCRLPATPQLKLLMRVYPDLQRLKRWWPLLSWSTIPSQEMTSLSYHSIGSNSSSLSSNGLKKKSRKWSFTTTGAAGAEQPSNSPNAEMCDGNQWVQNSMHEKVSWPKNEF